MKPILLSLALVVLIAAGCTPTAPLPTSTQAPSATPAETATATIVWFPATATVTPFNTPVQIPTPDQHPGLGEVRLADNFSNAKTWQTVKNDVGSVAFGQKELTIAIRESKGALSSLRQNTQVSDFYMEITANANLCRSSDSYGILLRATGSDSYYRYMVNCNGMLRLEKLVNGSAAAMQDWTPSGQVQPGAPLVVKLGVWALGAEMRFFANDVYQFSVTDKMYPSGTVGVFAKAAGDSSVTVSFSDLLIRSVDGSRVPTAEPSQTPSVTPAGF